MRATYVLGTFLALAVALTAARYVDADPERVPSLMEASELAEVADDDHGLQVDDGEVPEALNYDDTFVDPHAGRRRRRRRRKHRKKDRRDRSMDDEHFELRNASDIDDFNIIGDDAELKPYRTSEDIKKLGASQVVQADLYQRRLAPKIPVHILNSLGYEQSAVVITLEDGQRFLVVKGNQYGDGEAPALIPANKMAPDWLKITSKAVTRSVVSDFIAAVRPGYDVVNNNGNQAATRMMQLP